ncbi:NADH dehydrogenase FAD-containing subunit [Lipingzhangella halophila]|uniref:NADH dehydrogenase FAD-containing subunit n=1 Tax=Lipingzhangella halophila TaxID=1783352 RepID=A0A7W7RN80_9ACTN|nr:FAD-dependent oxidoreductase [Lipingzhangella halophila]MBB4935103.1 NADH dehydrogenase FAD-containing subunit [Lipingzhangella halophila]
MSYENTHNDHRVPTIAVVGGGYGGITTAKALDDVANIVLVDPQDSFVHNVAALRGVVDPSWAERIFLPYDRLLRHGRVVHDRAAHVDSGGVTLGSGERVAADYIVLATGSNYPFPAKVDAEESTTGIAMFHTMHKELAGAERVLLLGAGPVGLELAGEIKAVWPHKAVTIVDPASDVVAGRFPDNFRAEVRRQVDALGIELLLDTPLRAQPSSAPGESAPFTVTTQEGREITADIWFRCFGVEPVSDYLAAELAGARTADGHIEVDAELRLSGARNVFAIGDVTAIPEPKMAKQAGDHAEVVAANIKALVSGDGELTSYEPGPDGIALPLGPKGGVSFSWDYAPETGMLDAETTAQVKGEGLMLDTFAELLGRA